MKKTEFIRRELSRLPIVDFSNPEQAKILCPFHDDKNPSLDVRLERKVKGDGRVVPVGTFNCWSCSSHGNWNVLARKLNLQLWDEGKETQYADQPDNPFGEFARGLEQLSESDAEYVKPVTDGPWEGTWRGIPGSFLRSLGAESYWDKEFGEYRIFLPIRDWKGTPVGHVLARGDNSQIPDKKKYLNSKNFNGRAFWYGLDSLPEPKAIVIVEGPFDMIRFRFNGIPAIANLGVQLRSDNAEAVSPEKISQILAKGCTNVVLAFDADKAGREAVPGFTKCFQGWGFKVFDLNLSRYLESPEQKMDPGSCPQGVIDDLKAFLDRL